jgi:membrane fusion protein (multidrug efflux system)
MNKFSMGAIIAVYILVTSCHEESHHNIHNAKFLATSAVKQDTVVLKEYVSQVRSIQHIELRALEKGYLQDIYIDEGQAVKKGQILFRIMPLIYQAETLKAQAERDFAEIEYRTTKNLADSQIVSQNELALSKAQLDKAQAELSLAQAHLGFTEIRAPFDGITGSFHDVRLGSLVDEGELLTTLSDNSMMWVYFNVPEAEYLDYITEIQNVEELPNVKFQMANQRLFEYPGIIQTIEADFNNETGNIAFRATFPNPKKILRHGETGNILMPINLSGAIFIPQKATFEILDKKYVFVIENGNTVRSRQIEVGAEMPHLYQVVEGLSEGDTILVEGLRKVKNNDKVEFLFEPQSQIIAGMKALHAE